ncbi:caspase family protein [Kutzneria sp. NPDC051319]|uniref:caspase family protein n=1 Tax=Kutzneria sp. NPDC051319 TaxID=3155047 RepID=UPI00343BA482
MTEAPRLPDPERSRAVIIGSAAYDDPTIPQLPSAGRSAQAVHNLLTDPARGSLPRANCRLVADPRNSVEVIEAISLAAAEAEDLLLVYFVGHGLPGRDGSAYLAVRESRKNLAQLSAVPFGAIKDAFASRAATKVLIVDSCFSAQAIKEMMSGDPLTEALATFDGVFVAASADRYKTAAAPVGDRYTAFTAALLDVLESGVAGRGDVLTLNEVFDTVHARMVAEGLPEPHAASRDRAGHLGLVRNAGVGVSTPKQVAALPRRAVFASGYRNAHKTVSRVSWPAGLAALIVCFDQNFPIWASTVVLAAILAYFWADTFLPTDLQLEIDDRGMMLRVAKRQYAVDWINVANVTLLRLSSDEYELWVRLLPGAALRRPPRWRPGPRRTEIPNDYVFVRTRQLAATPSAVDDAVRRFGGVAWLRSEGIAEARAAAAAELRTVKVFRSRTLQLFGGGALLAVFGMEPASTILTTASAATMIVSALAALVGSAPGLFLAVCACFPAELEVGPDGLRLERFGRRLEFAWEDVEKIGLASPWRPSLGLWTVYVRLADSRELALVDALSLTFRRATLAAALAPYAGPRWDDSYRPDRGVRRKDNHAVITGRVAGWVTLGAPIATFLLLMNVFIVVDWSTAGVTVLFVPFAVVAAVSASALVCRLRWMMLIVPDGIAVGLSGRRIDIHWDDVRHVQMVTVVTAPTRLRRARRHTEIRIAPNRDDAVTRRPWSMPGFMVPVHDVYRLCVMDTTLFHLDASIDTVDRELRRHAGPERWRPRVVESIRSAG